MGKIEETITFGHIKLHDGTAQSGFRTFIL
jgi:hypothetical protein